jgi:hypothetical protein
VIDREKYQTGWIFRCDGQNNSIEQVLSDSFDANTFRKLPINIIVAPVHGIGNTGVDSMLRRLGTRGHFVER